MTFDIMLTRRPFERSWHATGHGVSTRRLKLGNVDTYLGVQEVNWNAQEEDENEQGKQLVRRVRR